MGFATFSSELVMTFSHGPFVPSSEGFGPRKGDNVESWLSFPSLVRGVGPQKGGRHHIRPSLLAIEVDGAACGQVHS